VVADPTASAPLRAAAVEQLARLGNERDAHGRALVRGRSGLLVGVRVPTEGDRPVRPREDPIALSGSGLESLTACPLQWFLQHEARAEGPASAVHQVRQCRPCPRRLRGQGEVPEDLDAIDAWVDRVWQDLRFEAPWQSAGERAQARAALARFLQYHQRAQRTLVQTEAELRTQVEVPRPDTGSEQVRLRGFLDRIEQDDQGRLVAIDLKNMRYPPAESQIATHAQLGVYQLLLRQAGHEVGGAALVQLRVADGKGYPDPKVQVQPPLGDEQPTWVEVQLGQAASLLRQEEFWARPDAGMPDVRLPVGLPDPGPGRELVDQGPVSEGLA
jgi:RecB family exonuclease